MTKSLCGRSGLRKLNQLSEQSPKDNPFAHSTWTRSPISRIGQGFGNSTEAESTQRLLTNSLQQADAKRNFLNRIGFEQEPSGFQRRMEQHGGSNE